LQIAAWKIHSRIFCYAESDGLILIKILSLLGSVSSLFWK
jgi:hypothetical protein